MAASLHYLTVQDVLWINLQLTKKVQHFNYARLEEAVFYQYAYGDSRTLFPQAARFISGFLKMRPFEAGNEATALVSCLAFLYLNGYTAQGDLRGWFDQAKTGKVEAIEAVAVEDPHAGHTLVPDVRGAIRRVLDEHAAAIAAAADEPARKSA
jgi:prophage maintenance system killer protein